MSVSLELPGGVRILNPVPSDPRTKTDSLNSIINDGTYYIGFSPIYNEDNGTTYKVSGCDANAGWQFEEDKGGAVDSVNGETGTVVLDKSHIGLGNVLNTEQIPTSEKGVAGGVATLDTGGKVPLLQLPNSIQGGITIIGFWNADTNTPDLTIAAPSQGEAYQVSVAGSTILNGISDWSEFDLAVWDDNLSGNWFKISSSGQVESVNGYTGAVTLVISDIEGGTLTEDVESIGAGTVGAINEGDIIPSGTSITELVKKLLQANFAPDSPNAGISTSPSSTQEIGDTVTFDIIPSFTQNDAGNLTNVTFKRNNSVIQSQSDLSTYSDLNQVIIEGSLNYKIEVNFDDGPIFTGPGKTGQILSSSGPKIASKNITGAYRNWFGPNGESEPSTSSEIRNLGYSYNNSFTLNTGDTSLVHVIAIPSTKSLTSVIDLDALNANITTNYVQSGTLTTVPDAGGNNINYKVYILTLAVAYSSNHRHSVTIS